MTVRLVITLVAAGLVAALSSPQDAWAKDAIVARDTAISSIYALDGQLVYRRGLDKTPKRAWMVRFKRHLRRATGIPRRATAGAIGRDAKGRVVFTFARAQDLSGANPRAKWFIYDLARKRNRPLGGLPSNCYVGWAALWRDSVAYTASCEKSADSGVFVRQGKRTQRLGEDPGTNALAFRDGTLAAIFDDGLDDFFVVQYLANGEPCVQRLDGSFGDATDSKGFFPTGLWIANGYITWTMGHPRIRPDFAILSAKVAAGCAAPGPVGLFAFTPETSTVGALAVDGRRLFYADGKTLRSHKLPAKPFTGPPPNDNFEQAEELSGAPPLSPTGRIAHATAQSGEPLADTKHTVWYAFRPTTSGTVYVSLPNSCPAGPEFCEWDLRYGVYTGTSRSTLTQIPPSDNGTVSPQDDYTRVDAVAGKTYWISVGSPRDEPRFDPFRLHIDKSPPAPFHG
jgi:hypothetical protein